MAQLGYALTILLRPYREDSVIAEDLAAFHAPSECYPLAFRNSAKRHREARRHACHVAGARNMRILCRMFRTRLGDDRWVYRHYGIVPY